MDQIYRVLEIKNRQKKEFTKEFQTSIRNLNLATTKEFV